MKTAISIPDDVFDVAEATAKRLKMTRSALYTAAIVDFVKAHKKDQVRSALDNIYSSEISSVDEPLAKLQRKAVREQW